jgi:hypothetical protein
MGLVDHLRQEIDTRTYGKDIRLPIRDALVILDQAIEVPIECAKILMTQDEYDAIDSPSSLVAYCIELEEGDDA